MDGDNAAVVPDLVVRDRPGAYAKGRDTRELILRSALHLLIEEGWQAMSMRRIAAECAMKFGNLTYHYRTREDLVRELLDAVIAGYEAAFDAIVDDPALSGDERLERYCALVLDDIPTKRTTRFFPELWALSNHDAFVHDRMHELYARARAPLEAIIAAMRPDLALDQRAALALFISFAMEGSTLFAGYAKPHAAAMPLLRRMAITSFTDLVRRYQAE